MGDTPGKTSAECILSEMGISWNPVEHRVFPTDQILLEAGVNRALTLIFAADQNLEIKREEKELFLGPI